MAVAWVPKTARERLEVYYDIRDPDSGKRIKLGERAKKARHEEWHERGKTDLHFMCAVVLQMWDMTLPDGIHGEMCRMAELEQHELMERHGRLAVYIEAARGFFKSSLVTQGHTIQCLVKNPDDTILLCTSTPTLVTRKSLWIRNQITDNPRLRLLYPDLIPGDKWTEKEFTVRRTVKGQSIVEPSVQVVSLGRAPTGVHPMRIKFDDLVDDQNFKTPVKRDAVRRFYDGCQPLLNPGGIEHTCGTPFHDDDNNARLRKLAEAGEMLYLRIPARREDGTLTWPERYSEGVLDGIRVKMGNDALFYAQYMLDIHPESEQKIKPDHLQWASEEIDPATAATFLTTYLGIDPSTGEGKDDTAIVVVGIDRGRKKYVLEVVHGRWQYDEAVDEFFRMARKWKPSEVRMETVSGFKTIGQVIERRMTETKEWYNLETDPRIYDKVARIASTLQPEYATGRVLHNPSLKGSEFERQLLYAWGAKDRNDLIDAASFAFTSANEGGCHIRVEKKAVSVVKRAGGRVHYDTIAAMDRASVPNFAALPKQSGGRHRVI